MRPPQLRRPRGRRQLQLLVSKVEGWGRKGYGGKERLREMWFWGGRGTVIMMMVVFEGLGEG